ncbi:hypothetical protein B0H17DRAFT_1192355 [Mycena rosella]|uniref:Uncharacterized protein n=1 Tax=Mycena rosella TaxID=1033263 RepID=A0AAD7M9G8_MYCRO|nr:hypothetical protein B0H17DRAFT_1192355 [Mycena rosella]
MLAPRPPPRVTRAPRLTNSSSKRDTPDAAPRIVAAANVLDNAVVAAGHFTQLLALGRREGRLRRRARHRVRPPRCAQKLTAQLCYLLGDRPAFYVLPTDKFFVLGKRDRRMLRPASSPRPTTSTTPPPAPLPGSSPEAFHQRQSTPYSATAWRTPPPSRASSCPPSGPSTESAYMLVVCPGSLNYDFICAKPNLRAGAAYDGIRGVAQ